MKVLKGETPTAPEKVAIVGTGQSKHMAKDKVFYETKENAKLLVEKGVAKYQSKKEKETKVVTPEKETKIVDPEKEIKKNADISDETLDDEKDSQTSTSKK